MKKILQIIVVILAAFFLAACTTTTSTTETTRSEWHDYVSELKLDMTSSTKKTKVTVKTLIDGDTTHFNINDSSFSGSVIKARYLAINTPESTGKIEEWGKTASNFTKGKLSTAAEILIESNDENWNHDSTGSRYLLFIWYKETANGDWRNLNLEILQNGYANPSNILGNIYGETCKKALDQAKEYKLNLWSGERDPNFYYGSEQYITLKDLRCHINEYNGTKVAVDGVVTRNYNNGVYIESYDAETELYYGMYAYYGTSCESEVSETLAIGKYVRVVGSVSEFNGSYQISGIEYDESKENTTKELETVPEAFEVNSAFDEYVYYNQPYTVIDASDFNTKKVTVDFSTEEEVKEEQYDYCYLIMGTTVKMENLRVNSVYTTGSTSESSEGAMTLTCTVNGQTIKVRTVVLKDSDGNVITESAYKNKTITVKGVVDCFNGEYQIKVLNYRDIKVNN